MPRRGRLPRVLVGVPYAGQLPGPFFESVAWLLQDAQRRTLELTVLTVPNSAVHEARDLLLKRFLASEADYLVMVDSDQVFVPANVERLVRWGKPYVAAMIVHRLGPPRPVAFVHEREELTERGPMHVYSPLTEEVWAYLARYDPKRLAACGGVGVLEAPDGPPAMREVPPEVLAGLGSPLLACDAVGTGMVCLSRACAERLDPGPEGRYFDWHGGGEDLGFCRRILGAGYAGFHPDWASSPREHGVFMDRGNLVGHLTQYSRGAGDLYNHLREVTAAVDGAEAELAEALANGALPAGLVS